MNLIVIVLGVAVLLVIAIIIGVAVDRQSRDRAWRRIAYERRRNWEERHALSDGTS